MHDHSSSAVNLWSEQNPTTGCTSCRLRISLAYPYQLNRAHAGGAGSVGDGKGSDFLPLAFGGSWAVKGSGLNLTK